HVLPQRLQGLLQCRIAGLESQVGHGRVEVHGADRMADDLALLADRLVRLVVLVVGVDEALLRYAAALTFSLLEIVIMWGLLAAFVDEVGGEIEVLFVARQAIELHQGELDLGVAAIATLLTGSGTERVADMLDVALHDAEPAPATGGLEIGNGALEHVAGVVELVVVAEVGPAVLGLAVEIPAVEIAVGLLRLFEIVDDGLDLGFDVGVAAVAQRVAGRLDPLA